MRWCTYDANDGRGWRLGSVDTDDAITPASRFGSLLELIDATAGGIEIPLAPQDPSNDSFRIDTVRLGAPIPEPRRNVLCIGKNYRDHAAEFAGSGFDNSRSTAIPEAPIVFTKFPSAVVGPNAVVDLLPEATSCVDYEAELAVIIGKGGRDIDQASAMDHVWGYTIINDVTARDRQARHKQWLLGKTLDGFCPMGPFAVTADELDLADTVITCHVNGELRQHANTADLIFGVPELIATISAGFTLKSGDIIATGTPAGVGIGFDPPRFLRPGDEVAITIKPIGTLTNVFR
jgi:2-keto-4-pentenoate hydratase/2-oxohepta-3-ene-1,7-dioic acid hydratase in catechol pathway